MTLSQAFMLFALFMVNKNDESDGMHNVASRYTYPRHRNAKPPDQCRVPAWGRSCLRQPAIVARRGRNPAAGCEDESGCRRGR